MNSYINYVVEANIGLILFMVAYAAILAKETNFSLQRFFLVSGIIASLTFPLFHLSFSDNNIPSLSQFLPSYLLPELTIGEQATFEAQPANTSFDVWQLIGSVYITGLLISVSLFVTRLIQLIKKLTGNSFSRLGKYKIIESSDHKHTFSFFNYIFLGQTEVLSTEEKQRILQHETVHARQLHSFDILLLNVTGIVFWFNPIIKTYKKIFIQLHEFEADARAVEDRDVNDYCTLLAKVALQSADFPLANHFNNSLTLKRIKMMRTLKQKIKTWKILALASVIPLVFFVVACQDQVMNDITEIAKNSTNALIVPENIQARYETLKQQNPNSNYILVEFNEAAEKQLAEMESKYGLPKHIELYTPDGQKHTVKAKPDSGVTINSGTPQLQTFAIIEFSDQMRDISNNSKLADEVYNVVEETATPPNGMNAFYKDLMMEMKYPIQARTMGIEGRVFVQFVIQKDGTLSEFTVLKGVGSGLDEEAIRAIQAGAPWIPGKVGGKAVKQRMVMPVTFSLSESNFKEGTKAPENAMEETVVVGTKIN